ncbi:hypothetical protein GCM10010116_12160 [Microbispora rosea subsp. aerata]|nr:PASTA domain-containing protein [Microbispora rosea]GGO06169.1 hypothetical protein GCM10010116_12160 [Microbispora rosea subsp. aerata]GIH55176.1 hypothetical protein Mro02_20900 [Microbispora rosea subsp. aerata]GLJ82626.1 hypothetical protein GCM10017588_13510 [Microbispora rosea subsp. aerata]
MNVEEALRDAMAAQVADVQAPPMLGQAIRRRNRRHVVRFRLAGAALVTAAVAVGVPVALTAGPGTAPAGGVLTGTNAGGTPGASPIGADDTVAVPGIIVPDLIGKTAAEASPILKEAGYTVRVTEITTDEAPAGTVYGQMPQPGTTAPAGAAVTIVVAVAPIPSPGATAGDAPMPQDLGNLGDGRTLGGVHVGYLPEGLEWGKWSAKDGFGTRSYTTSWAKPGLEPGMYSVQMIVYRKQAAEDFAKRLKGFAAQGAKPIEVDGKKAYLMNVSEGGDRVIDGGTRTIAWTLAPGVGVEVMMSPDYVSEIGDAAADRELKKIAAGVALDK